MSDNEKSNWPLAAVAITAIAAVVTLIITGHGDVIPLLIVGVVLACLFIFG